MLAQLVTVFAISAIHATQPGPPARVFVASGSPVGVYAEGWKQTESGMEGSGRGDLLTANRGIGPDDFHLRARLRMLDQKGSAAAFFLDDNYFGFEGAKETVFVSGPLFGGLKLLDRSKDVFTRESWIRFEVTRKGRKLSFRINGRDIYDIEVEPAAFETFGFSPMRSTMQVSDFSLEGTTIDLAPPMPRGYTIPLIDLADQSHRQVVIDREPGQYLGHPTTVLLEDGKTMITVYPKGHGRGAIVMKRSTDGGKSWSGRLGVPENWATSKEVPTIHRVIDPKSKKKRLIMFSGLYPIRMAVSEDDGISWSPLKPIGDFGGIVTMGFVERLRNGDYLAMFHDDGRFIRQGGSPTGLFTLFQIISRDGGLTWSKPRSIHQASKIHLCEPGVVRSPDGKQLAILLRENSRRRNSHVMFSNDESKSWSKPRELPAALTGDRHTARYAQDGRLFISFRDTTHISPTQGDWVAWVGTYDDIVHGRQGQYRVRLMDNHHAWDCAYPGVELLPDGTFVTTTYGHWRKGESPYIVSVRLKLEELDEIAGKRGR